MDRLQWTLELVDRLSGPGRNAAAAFAHLTDEQIGAVAAARRLAEAEGKAAAALKDAKAGVRSLTAEDLDLVDASRRARREFEAMDKATNGIAKAAGPGMTGSLLQAAFWQGLARSILNASQRIVEFGLRAGVAIGKKLFDLSSWAQDTRSSLSVFAGSTASGNEEFSRIADTAKVMGLAVQATTDSYKALRAARFGADEAETFIKLGADLQTVTGASDDAVQSFYRASSQVKSKGRLQTEELMQIQEAVGLSQGAVFEAIGKAAGVATDKVGKLLEGGKISADVGIAAIQTAVLELVHAGKAGEATTREVSTTLRGVTRLAKAGAESWMIGIGERLMPAFDSVAKRVMETFKGFGESGKIAAFTEAVYLTFQRLVGAIEEAWPRIERILGRGIDGATDSLLELSNSFGDLIDSILDTVEFVQDNWGAIKATFIAVSAVVVAAIGAIGIASAINAVRTIASVGRTAAAFVGLGKAARAARAAQLAVGAAEAVGSAASGAGSAVGAAGAGAAGAAGGKGLLASIGNALKGLGKTMLAWGKVAGTWLVTGVGGALGGLGQVIWGGISSAGSSIASAAAALGAAGVAAFVAAVAAWGVAIWQGIQLWKEWDTGALVAKIQADWAGLVGWFQGIWASITSTLSGAVEGAYSIGAGIVGAIGQGISDAAAGLAERAWALGTGAIQSVKDAIGWNSPPAAFVELGQGSASAFLDSLQAGLPRQLDLGLSANMAANDGAPAVAAAVSGQQPGMLDTVESALSGLGRWLGLSSGPSNDVASASVAPPLPMAVGSDLGYRSVAGGMTVQQGSSQSGPMQFSFNVDVTINGQASKEDATELAAQIKQQIMPSVRAEIQKTFSAAAGSAQ
jgi:tape measure domain-containing protein